MLNRIEATNFKSFKHLDYKCAKLNLLTGLNGSGKSSFVQLLLLLRACAMEGIYKPEITIDLRKAKVASDFSDIRYCYASPDAPTLFSFDHTVCFDEDEYGNVSFAAMDGDLANRLSKNMKGTRVVASSGRNRVVVWHPEALEAQRRFDAKFNPAAIDDMQPAIDELKKSTKLIKDAEKQRLYAYHVGWLGMQFIEAFRQRPLAVCPGRAVPITYWRPWWENNRPFDSEGDDAIEWISRIGGVGLIASDKRVHDHSELSRVNWVDAKGRHQTDEELLSQVPKEERTAWENVIKRAEQRRWRSALKDQVNAWLGEISPGAKYGVEVDEVGDEETFIAKVFFDDDEAHSFKPEHVGLGISYALPVILALLASKPGNIVIVENPEAHIHPKGQAKLGALIARAAASGVQVFVETHSDHVINGVRVAVREGVLKPEDVNIAFFERKEHLKDDANDSDDTEIYSEIRNIKVDINGSLSEYPEDFMDEWNNQLLELM